MGIRVGDVVMIGKFDSIINNGIAEIVASFKAPSRKDGYVMLFMGVQPRDGSDPLDLDEVMNELGWVRKDAD